MSGPVPVAESLADIYPLESLAAEGPRWNTLLAAFDKQYGHAASFVARSPGRVNIIGEHIDYSLYSVLPMAITADALLAVTATPVAADATTFSVRVANVQGDKFVASEFEVPVDGNVEIDSKVFEWTNYFKSGLRGALELLRKKRGAGVKPCNMEIMMDGNVPVGGGLSSSAAFVSASALAVMLANGETPVDKKELTELAIVSERAVGVNSGGYVSPYTTTHDIARALANTTAAWTNRPPSYRRRAQLSSSRSAPPSLLVPSSSLPPTPSCASSSRSPSSRPTSTSPVPSTTTYELSSAAWRLPT